MAGDHTGVWSSTKETVALSAKIPANATGRPYGWNDMDMVSGDVCGVRGVRGGTARPQHKAFVGIIRSQNVARAYS